MREPLLSHPAHGWINLHFSLLPRWRGAAPVQHALIAGDARDRRSRVPARARARRRRRLRRASTDPIAPDATAGDAARRARRSTAPTCSPTSSTRIAGGTAVAVPQAGEPTLAPKLGIDDGRIDWTSPPTRVLDRHPRRHARARRVHDGRRRAAQGARRAPRHRGCRAARAGRARCSTAGGARRHRRRDPLELRARAARRANGRWPPPTGGAARARGGGAMSGRDGVRHGVATAVDRSRRGRQRVTPSRLRRSMLAAVRESDAYANLLLPTRIARAGLDTADAGARDRAHLRHAAHAGLLRRGHRARRGPPGRARSTRPCSTCCASASTSCSSTRVAPHAAVNESVELARRGRPRRPPASPTPCCARSRATRPRSGGRASPRARRATTSGSPCSYSHPRLDRPRASGGRSPPRVAPTSSRRCSTADNAVAARQHGRAARARRDARRRRGSTPDRYSPIGFRLGGGDPIGVADGVARAASACRTRARSSPRSR